MVLASLALDSGARVSKRMKAIANAFIEDREVELALGMSTFSGEFIPPGTPVQLLQVAAVGLGGTEYLVRAPRDPSRVYDETLYRLVGGHDDRLDELLQVAETHVTLTVHETYLRPRCSPRLVVSV